jgi:hypothetical protein
MTRLSLLRTLTFLSECVAHSQRPPSRFDPVSFTVLLPRCRRAQPADKGLLFPAPKRHSTIHATGGMGVVVPNGQFPSVQGAVAVPVRKAVCVQLGERANLRQRERCQFRGEGKREKFWEGGGLTSFYGRMGR